MVLDVTITDDTKRTLYEKSRVYMPQSTDSLENAMVYGPTFKLGVIRDTSIQPFAAKTETFEAPIPEGIGKVRVHVGLSYQPRPGDLYPIHQRTVILDSGKEATP